MPLHKINIVRDAISRAGRDSPDILFYNLLTYLYPSVALFEASPYKFRAGPAALQPEFLGWPMQLLSTQKQYRIILADVRGLDFEWPSRAGLTVSVALMCRRINRVPCPVRLASPKLIVERLARLISPPPEKLAIRDIVTDSSPA